VRINWIDSVLRVVVDCCEPTIIKIRIELDLRLVIDQEIYLSSLSILLLDVFSLSIFHSFFLLVQGGNLLLLFVCLFGIKSSFESNLDVVLIFFVLLVATLSPVSYYILVFHGLMS